MQISVYQPQNKYLKTFIDCYFFLKKTDEAPSTYVSYPNTNYTLSFYKSSTVLQSESEAIISPSFSDNSCFYNIHHLPFETKLYGKVEEYAIVFKPFALKKIVKGTFNLDYDLKAEAIFGQCEALKDQLFSEKSNLEKVQVLDQFLYRLFLKTDVVLPQEMQYLQWSGNVSAMANDFGINRKKLYRSFENHLGLSPKTYFKIRRFRQALDLINSQAFTKLTDLAIDTGYFDQSHMIREFKQLSAKTPSALNQNLKSIDNHLLWDFS
jgi:AraC-like DNA-binding protein